MALRYSFDQTEEAQRLEQAIDAVLARGIRTPDLMQAQDMQPVTTSDMGDAILEALHESI